MRKSKSKTRKKQGRLAALTAKVDLWAAHNGAETRSDALHRLVEIGLEHSRPRKRRPPGSAARASELASEQIDKLHGFTHLSARITEGDDSFVVQVRLHNDGISAPEGTAWGEEVAGSMNPRQR